MHAEHVLNSQRFKPLTKLAVVAVPGIGLHDSPRHALFDRRGDLLQGDLGLGQKADLFGHSSLAPSRPVGGPGFGQIESVGNGLAGLLVGHRQRHRYLAVVLLAQLPAILTRYPDRMPPFLGNAGVVDDPRLNRPAPLNRRKCILSDRLEYRAIIPRCVGHQMMQRLVGRPHPLGRQHRPGRCDPSSRRFSHCASLP